MNIVIRQDPAADEEADEGSTVTLTVSAGRRDRQRARTSTGTSFEEAKERLEADGFAGRAPGRSRLERRRERRDPHGSRRRARPRSAAARCTVFVSTGESRSRCRTWPEQDADTAFDALANAGSTPREQSEASNDVEEGKVTRTDPAGGQQARKGAQRHRLFVSTGPATSRSRRWSATRRPKPERR